MHSQSPKGNDWSDSCRVYGIQVAQLPLRSNKEAIKMLTDSSAPRYKLRASGEKQKHVTSKMLFK